MARPAGPGGNLIISLPIFYANRHATEVNIVLEELSRSQVCKSNYWYLSSSAQL